jgi:hypothetical protein
MPSLESSDPASCSVSPATSMIPSPSRSHCTAAPVTKIAASSAYVVWSPICQATVESSPSGARGIRVPWFMSTNDPVPYVFLPSPGSRQR